MPWSAKKLNKLSDRNKRQLIISAAAFFLFLGSLIQRLPKTTIYTTETRPGYDAIFLPDGLYCCHPDREVLPLRSYVELVMLFNFVVDGLLLLVSERLCGYKPIRKRIILAAALGGVYGGLCLLPALSFLAGSLWRILSLLLMIGLAYGWRLQGLRRGCVFLLLTLALNGICGGYHSPGLGTLLSGAAILGILCAVGFCGHKGSGYIPVTLRHKGRSLTLTALEDTGNSLKDPVSGRSVLVIDAASAEALLGLTSKQLADPVGTVAAAPQPGLRLIPIQTVANGALLLAMRIEEVCIGTWKGSALVAFSPVELDRSGTYQALTGGTVC